MSTSDESARDAIATDLGSTLFVEAGAGSGKTKSLVDRVCALVTEAQVPMGAIVAVTFTEKAASELRDRIRRELERIAREATGPAASRAADALDELDGAAIATLHSFAQRILGEFPIEAGLPPRVEVIDDIGSQLGFDDRWTRFVDQLVDDPAMERSLLIVLTRGIALRHLRAFADQCNDNWDLVAQRIAPAPEPRPLAEHLGPVLAAVDAVRACGPACTDPDDKLLAVVEAVAAWHDQLLDAPDEYEQLRMLGELPTPGRSGRKGNWPAECPVETVRERITAAHALAAGASAAITEEALHRLGWEIAQFTLAEAAERRRAGRLEFHDLLVLAAQLLRDPEHGWAVRQRLRDRYQRLLLDEFQDTDPIQCDLAALIASGDPAAHTVPWDQLVPDPGRLFVVGDPKQSIYRFRRADIGAFLAARDAFGAHPVQLTRNFRSVTPVIEFVNAVFGRLITAAPGSQPAYAALDARRDPAPVGPAVALLGADAHPDGSADDLRVLEADDVAATVVAAVAEGWSVWRSRPDGTADWEPCRLGDICVLIPTRTSLDDLEDALDAYGIPYRAETSSLVYSTREIRDLLVVLQAVDDPTDQLALVSALRSPVLGCGDDDLADYALIHRGRWNHQGRRPETLPADHPVALGLDALAAWHDARTWCTPSELLDRIVRERRVLELGFARGRPRDLWRRVRFVVEQARAFTEADGGSLRDFLHWAELQGGGGARVVETILPETDDDAVRILTVHGAKGLEFPITIVSGTTGGNRRQGGVELVFPSAGGWGVHLKQDVETAAYREHQDASDLLDFHEKLRLLYVAATRAEDHLVVSVHRKERKLDPDAPQKWKYAELLWDAAQEAGLGTPFDPQAAAGGDVPGAGSGSTGHEPVPAAAEWRADLDRALAAARRPRVRAATSIARDAADRDAGLAKDARDLELPPWNKGRYGTSVGRAVHAVLQNIDLATGDGLDAAAAAQAAAEGVAGHERRIAARVRAALATDVVRLTHTHPFRREMYVAVPVAVDGGDGGDGGDGDPVVIEGYIDLVVDTPDGLVVVDYKTDAWNDDRELDEKLERYRLQGATYALALAAATGRPVVRCVFVFLGDDGAVERDVSDLPRATADVTALLAASSAAATTP